LSLYPCPPHTHLYTLSLHDALPILILAMPLVAAFGGAKSSEVVIGLGLAVFVNLMAQIWLALARRQLRYDWLPWATGTYDITLRSEEHTSELQSRENLVCRLLLEKK